MITFLCIIILSVLFLSIVGGISYKIKKDYKYVDAYDYVTMPFLIGIFCIIIAWLILYMVCFAGVVRVPERSEYVELYGMSNTSGVSGNFFLGCGNIEDKQYVFYNTKDGDEVKTEKVPLENCSFILNDSIVYLEIKYVKLLSRVPALMKDKVCRQPEYIFHLCPENINKEVMYDISKF